MPLSKLHQNALFPHKNPRHHLLAPRPFGASASTPLASRLPRPQPKILDPPLIVRQSLSYNKRQMVLTGSESPSRKLMQHRAKPSTQWFDAECRDTRRKTRAAERRYWRKCKDNHKLAWTAKLRALHLLYRRKSDDFWRTEIKASNGNTRKLWKTSQGTLGEKCSDETSAHTADDFAAFFQDKVEAVLASTSATPLYDGPFKATESTLDN